MNEKIAKLQNERTSITKDYSSKEIYTPALEKNLPKGQTQTVTVKQIVKETNDTKSFILYNEAGLLPFRPGAYITIYLEINGIKTSRAYSLSSSPSVALKGIYQIAIKRVKDGLVSNYMLDEIKVGDTLEISLPSGDFGYEVLRDEENVIAIAGGSGITPFMSMAKSILDKIYDYNLTVFYSVKSASDIIFKKDIEEINKRKKNVKFIITLTRDKDPNYDFGHINKIMIEPYLKEFNTVLMCGPKSLYQAMNDVLSDLNIPEKNVHYENFFMPYIPNEETTYKLKVLNRDKEINITCKSNETILSALENQGIKAPSLCRVGECGFCRSILVEGKVKMIGAVLTKAEKSNGYIHPCVSYPESDITIKLDL